ncbi:MAG TPA: tetratricopeptide repeat protein [Chitinophagaceae bacterium]|nr:tetratricopeptide repeat protein [Chitinophagaceae bacterium]
MNRRSVFISLIFFFLITSCKQSNETLLDKANELDKKGKHDKAIDIYTKIIKRNNRIQLAYFNRGLTYLKTKNYDKALADFNKIMSLHPTRRGLIFIPNPNSPFASEVDQMWVPYNDALLEGAIAKYYMDSIKSSFNDFQALIDINYQKSNSLLWQGMLWIKNGENDKACEAFIMATQAASTNFDKDQADNMIDNYCQKK